MKWACNLYTAGGLVAVQTEYETRYQDREGREGEGGRLRVEGEARRGKARRGEGG